MSDRFTPQQIAWIDRARTWWRSQGEITEDQRIRRLGALLESVDLVPRLRAERAEMTLRRIRADLEDG